MTQLWIALGVVVVAVAAAIIARRRRVIAAPTQPRGYAAPVQLDRADFAGHDEPWMVVVFSSASCDSCREMVAKAAVLASAQVGVVEVEHGAAGELHRRYAIEAVPIVAVADAAGVVHRSWIGPVSATDLWAGVAEARHPGSTPSGVAGSCQASEPGSASDGPPLPTD